MFFLAVGAGLFLVWFGSSERCSMGRRSSRNDGKVWARSRLLEGMLVAIRQSDPKRSQQQDARFPENLTGVSSSLVPSMASMILKASLVAASVGRSAASRCVAVVSRSASDPLLPSLSLYRSGSTFAAPPGRVEFVAAEKDLESDEALWALYERWCKAFNEKRDPLEMSRRFSKFKETALMVDSTNKANLPYKLEINRFADGKNAWFVRPKIFRVSRISRTFRGAASEFEKEP